jgi:hypothetical protein
MEPISIDVKFTGKLPGEELAISIIKHFETAPPEVQAAFWKIFLEDVEFGRALTAPLRMGLLSFVKALGEAK